MDQQQLLAAKDRYQCRRIEAGKQHVFAAPGVGSVFARFVGIADFRRKPALATTGRGN